MIVVSPVASSIATSQALQLDVFVDSPDWEGLFDSLEIWRSRLTDAGPFVSLVGDAWSPASLPVLATPPSPTQVGPLVNVSGLPLSLLINEKTPVDLTFTGTNPITLSAAGTQIVVASNGLLRAFVLGKQLYIQTGQTGAGASLRVVGGDAAPLLGLSVQEPGSLSFGVDARIPLVHGVSDYPFTDLNGSRTFWYKTRFFNSSTQVASEFSLPFQGTMIAGVGVANVIRATIDVVDARGVAIAGVPVILFNRFAGTQVAGKTMIGGPTNGLTDENGHFETLLVRGTQITVGIGGTNIARDITVPTDPNVQTIDLLDPTYGSNDVFNVQIPNLRYAVRRSL